MSLNDSKLERLTQLRQTLETHFNQSELRTLCFDLGVDYDGLPGESKGDKARELLGYLERYSRLPDLIKLGQVQRPDISWEELPQVPEPASPAQRPATPTPGPGEGIHVTISDASISGQVAVGQGISQIQTVGGPPSEVTESDLSQLRQALADLKTQVQARAPVEKQAAALAKVTELEQALAEPDISELELATMEAVKLWFAKRVPELAQAVSAVITHPSVGKRVQAAGAPLAAEFRRRFG